MNHLSLRRNVPTAQFDCVIAGQNGSVGTGTSNKLTLGWLRDLLWLQGVQQMMVYDLIHIEKSQNYLADLTVNQ